MEKEICICSAVKYGDLIFRGHRHVHCIAAAHDKLGYELSRKEVCALESEQGFMTSKNRFVGRKEGCQLQKDAGIESVDKLHPYLNGELYSEDLY